MHMSRIVRLELSSLDFTIDKRLSEALFESVRSNYSLESKLRCLSLILARLIESVNSRTIKIKCNYGMIRSILVSTQCMIRTMNPVLSISYCWNVHSSDDSVSLESVHKPPGKMSA